MSTSIGAEPHLVCSRREGRAVPTEFVEADLKSEIASLDQLLGDTRVRFRRGETGFASSQKLIDLDLEIRNALQRPLSPDLQLEVRRLTARLRALDPH